MAGYIPWISSPSHCFHRENTSKAIFLNENNLSSSLNNFSTFYPRFHFEELKNHSKICCTYVRCDSHNIINFKSRQKMSEKPNNSLTFLEIIIEVLWVVSCFFVVVWISYPTQSILFPRMIDHFCYFLTHNAFRNETLDRLWHFIFGFDENIQEW